MKFFVVFFLTLFVFAFSSLEYANAFETHGGPGAVYPWLSAIKIGNHLGLPVHQEITKDGLYFLNDPTKTLLADQHIFMEGDQSSANHFDNCAFSESIAKINYKYRISVGYLNPKFPQPDKSAEEFGRLLHTVQDFYAHTNWVEMKRTTLVDQGYSYWTDIPSFSLNTGDNQVFSFEVQKDSKTNELVYSKFANKVIRVKLGDNNYKDIGLISGTYGEPEENKCLPGASVPHGSSVGPYFSFADNEKLNKPDALNKDHPKQKGHAAARDLAVKQTEHEFCRLVELTRTQWGQDGVDIIYKNWVKNTNIAISKCPIIEKSSTIITSNNTSIGSVHEFLIPNWIKQNAKWWSDGITSDKEFANSVGFLVKEKIITVNIPTNNDGTILVNENLTIPDWLRNNAKWWSDEIISDQEFTSAIEYMINQNIISFSDRAHNLYSIDDQEFFENLYEASLWNEAAFASLASINDAEVEILGDLAANAWDEYHLSNNLQEMDNAKSFELLLDKQDSLTLHIQNLQVLAKDTSEQVKTIAKMYGSKSVDLDSIAESAEEKIDHPFKISDADNLNEGLEEFTILDKKATVPGVNPFDFLANQEIDNQDIINLINEAEIPPDNLGSLNTPGITIEDRIMLLLMEMIKNMDKQISEQDDKIQSLNSDAANSSMSPVPTSVDIESMKLKQLIDKRGQLFDICRQIIDRYNETAKGTIQSLRNGGSVAEKESPDSTVPKESTEPITPPQDTQEGKQVVVLVIGGKYYPLSQFFDVPAHTPNCDSMHYHSEFSKVRSSDGVLISDPNPSTCGFGKVGLLPIDVITMTQEQIDAFKAATGYEP